MHDAVRNILKIVEREGLKDNHHFFISFVTKAEGVKLSERVRKKYPAEITIVLQHQFQDLIVEEDYFTIKLSFDGISEIVRIPFKSITSFADPEEKFAIQFEYPTENLEEVTIETTEKTTERSEGNVISLDQFRKKKKS